MEKISLIFRMVSLKRFIYSIKSILLGDAIQDTVIICSACFHKHLIKMNLEDNFKLQKEFEKKVNFIKICHYCGK